MGAEVPRDNLKYILRTRRDLCGPILLCLADLGGVFQDEEEGESLVSWDDFLYMFVTRARGRRRDGSTRCWGEHAFRCQQRVCFQLQADQIAVYWE